MIMAIIGGFVLAKDALSFLNVLYKTLIRPGKNLKKLGEWAVVTGATDGIGKAYATTLAGEGMGVVEGSFFGGIEG
jgi:17beta-estradiol 17-dehydrogenase / very-long-chain 3-oxoacyl-CoA reductase